MLYAENYFILAQRTLVRYTSIVKKHGNYWHIVDALVLNLAIADFLYCLRYCSWSSFTVFQIIFSLPILARNLLRDMIWDLGLIACKATSAFTMLNLYASVWLLVAMSFDRYFAVCNPVKARQLRNKTNINLMIISCWIFASLLTIPAWIWRNLYSFGPNQLASSQQNHTDLSNSSVSTTITVIVSNYTTSSNQSEYIDSELDDFSNMVCLGWFVKLSLLTCTSLGWCNFGGRRPIFVIANF